MKKGEVYFIKISDNDIQKRNSGLLKLLQTLDPFSIYKKGEFIPIKLTIGDTKCIYNIRPEVVKLVVSVLKKKNVKPFLFDTNVIYAGARLNAIDHLTLAQNKGFNHSRIGAPFIIADGVFGQDGKEYELNSKYLKKIKIPSLVGMLDSLLVLSHATCHILSGYAGALKNVAMGMSSRPTKQAQHSSVRPQAIEKNCTSCACCIEVCPVKAISFINRRKILNQVAKAFIVQEKCIGCGECLCACKFDAISINWEEDKDIFARRLVDVAGFILSRFKNKFFINFAFDITKECDCISTKNERIVCKDIGILASKDLVGLDKATVDLINSREDIIQKEKSSDVHIKMLEYAHEKGLGNIEYSLINV